MSPPSKHQTPEEFEAAYEMLKVLVPQDDNVERDETSLLAELTAAHALYTRNKSSARGGMHQALGAVIDHIDANVDLPLNRATELLAPLRRLLSSLSKLNDGVVEPCLQPAPQRPGARALSLDELEFRFVVAKAADAWPGEVDEACRFVAKKLNQLGFTQQRRQTGHDRPIDATTVKNWLRDMPKNWGKIAAETGLSLDQYLYRLCGIAVVVKNPERRDSGTIALLHAIPRYFGHLAKK